MALNRYGLCPNPECRCNWDAGDILQNLRMLHAFTDKTSQDLVNIAFNAYGYNPQNPKNFSKVIAISIVNDTPLDINAPVIIIPPDFYQCPSCRKVWDANTEQQFDSLEQAKQVRGFYEHNNRELSQENEV
jgi:hypothetical protein